MPSRDFHIVGITERVQSSMESVGTTKSMLFKKGQNCNYKHYEESDALNLLV